METFLNKLRNTRWEELEPNTVEAAKLVLLDTLGAYIVGVNQPETEKVVDIFSENGNYEIIHTGQLTTATSAALIHGTAVVAIEMDEGNQYSKGHPAAHVVPVLLTLMQEQNEMNGKDFLLHLITGYEACSRFGRAVTLHPDMHAHGTWGVMGAATTALLTSRLSLKEIMEGINVSATFALPTIWSSALEGKLIRNIYVGHSIEAGIQSMKLTKAGYEAPKGNPEYVFTKLLGSKWDNKQFNVDPQIPWDIERNYFKSHAFCRYTHAPLDAFKSILLECSFAPEDIEYVDVFTYSRAATLSNQNYHNPLSAKFSIPYALASWMYFNKSDQSIFCEDNLNDERVKSLARKVHVKHTNQMDVNYPTVMPAKVDVHLVTGEVITTQLDGALGGPESRFTKSEIIEKFNILTEPYLTNDQIGNIVNVIFSLEQQKDVNILRPLLRKKETISG